ncbi:Protein of unknown function [Papillibacter cinnamivorans DSM 12816]|uniref:DUF2500 domain-containing protein n=2 Tax=Papillibacter TaxID=100175 RepID=A0A1W2ASX9_9FIRM|nr:DUF2500 domain-containing protein [Papillibacter cinnamivorans]SMC63694.1 Protein of unknown function [Papillibacter cinnamivorans DSM 12816]
MFGNGFFFSIFPLMFGSVFVFIIGIIVVTAVRGIGQWNKNNRSPVLTVDAEVVAKRSKVTHHRHNTSDADLYMSSSTSYFATFQVESGDRMELGMSGREYGMLAEGDLGRLTFQGTRYLGFERK